LIASDGTIVSCVVLRRILCALHVGVIGGIHAGMCLCFGGNFVCQKNVVCESGQVKDCLHVKTRMVPLCLMDVTTCVPELHGSTPLFPRLNAYVFSDIQLSLLNSIHLQTEHACEAVQ
jgi:hypothetical protein